MPKGSGEKTQLRPLFPYPALFLRSGAERVLVAADLHIGWEVALVDQGIHVPSQADKLFQRLRAALVRCKPNRLILLGDVKHTVGKVELAEWRDVPEFFERVLGIVPRVEVVSGNHDGDLEPLTPPTVKIHKATGLSLWGKIGLFHGHAWPGLDVLMCQTLVMAHLHPVVAFRDRFNYRIIKPVWVRAPCKMEPLMEALSKRRRVHRPPTGLYEGIAKGQRVIVMPAFNEFLGGQPVNRGGSGKEGLGPGELLGPFLRSGCVKVESAEVNMLDGTFLGSIGQLRAFG